MPRFCVKNGKIDWSASPNAEEFEVGEKHFAGCVLTGGALRQVVHLHYMYKKSRGLTGRAANLRGATLDQDARALIAAKLTSEKGISLWAEVISSMEQ